MGLRVRFVESLDQVVGPVIEHLTEGIDEIDLFQTDYIVVPNAGVRAWLLQQLAYTMGSSGGLTNGVVANVEIGFIGMLDRFVSSDDAANDPWDVEYLTFVVLQAMSQLGDDDDVRKNVARLGGGLKAARIIADRFDRYHARRPHMIRCWEAGRAELSPYIGEDEVVTDEGRNEAMLVVPPLLVDDHWQFTLWRVVRELIGRPSPPARTAEHLLELKRSGVTARVPARIAVVGLQSIAARHVEVLRALATVTEVNVILVHPSPELAEHWSEQFASRPVAPGIAIARPQFSSLPKTFNPLVYSWLRGSMDLQHMLAINNLGPASHISASSTANNSLLSRVHAAIARPSHVEPRSPEPDDQSIVIHRAHNLARQVEVLHDALLHAFDDIPDLQPHEVVVVSPVIEKAAPLLQATFQRQVTNRDGRSFTLPLVVADRGLREVDEGSRLLADLLGLLRSRFGISDVMPVITSPLVLKRFGISNDDVDTWRRYIDRARVRWGLDESHRTRTWSVDLGDEALAHTWALAIRRSLLGAMLPDADSARIELGGVVPMVDVEPNEIRAITTLAEILNILGEAELMVQADLPVTQWCSLIEKTLTSLVRDDDGDLDDALGALAHFERHSSVPLGDESLDVTAHVTFAHIAALITEQVSAAPGRQPLRTGAITATSTIPLRSVPFRVVCVVGMDDGALSSGDAEGDDLESRQHLIGDLDARLEQRRTLLDAVVAAQDRLIITCIGRSVKNNVMTQLVTPLAEFVDLCRALGVGDHPDHTDLSTIEVLHPRHFNSPTNFIKGQLVHDRVWSHSPAALAAARLDSQGEATASTSILATTPLQVVPLELLEQLLQDPLRIYVRDSLGISTWREGHDDEPAVIPLSISNRERRVLAESLLVSLRNGETDEMWEAAVIAGGEVPPGAYRGNQLAEITSFIGGMRAAMNDWAAASVDDVEVSLPLGDGRVLRGRIPAVHTRDDGTSFVLRLGFDKYHDSIRAVLPLHMLVLSALGYTITDGPFITRHEKNPDQAARRNIQPPADLDIVSSTLRLATLVDLVEIARARPCPSFGGAGAAAVTDRASGEGAFQQAVAGRTYKSSLEALVFGYSPLFDDVFPEDSPVLDFWADLTDTLKPAKAGGGNSPKGWTRYSFS